MRGRARDMCLHGRHTETMRDGWPVETNGWVNTDTHYILDPHNWRVTPVVNTGKNNTQRDDHLEIDSRPLTGPL